MGNGRKNKRFSLILVEWVDSKRLSDGWIYTDDTESAVCLNLSVGWLLNSKGGCLTVLPHISKDKKTNYGAISIPKCAVKKISKLSEK